MGSDFTAALAENGKVHLSLSAPIFCVIIPGRKRPASVHRGGGGAGEELQRAMPRAGA